MKLAKSFVLFVLRTAAKIQLWKIKPTIVGIGGSSGKTSVAKFVEIILSESYRVRGTGGKNSETGIPLSILDIKISKYDFFEWLKVLLMVFWHLLFDWRKYEYLIAEMGIDSPKSPKNMDYLLRFIKPKVAALTNIDYEHSVYFESYVKKGATFEKDLLDLIAKEELSLLKSLSEGSIVILNLDDELINSASKNIRARKITVSSKNKNADFYIEKVEVSLEKFEVTLSHNRVLQKLVIEQALPVYFAHSLALSIAICSVLGIQVKDAIKSLEKNFSLPPGRASIFEGVKGTVLIDSSYNSSYKAASGMLGLLKILGETRRKVAILGDMRELGEMSKALHSNLASEIIKNCDFAIIIGEQMNKYVSPMLKKSNFPYKGFEAYAEAKKIVSEEIRDEDLILIKASQNTLFLERVVEDLLKDKNDSKYLARRGKYWEKVKNAS